MNVNDKVQTIDNRGIGQIVRITHLEDGRSLYDVRFGNKGAEDAYIKSYLESHLKKVEDN